MPESKIMPETVFSATVKAKGRVYFFDIKKARNGNRYLTIVDAWIKDGQKTRNTVTLFSDQATEFFKVLEEAKSMLV